VGSNERRPCELNCSSDQRPHPSDLMREGPIRASPCGSPTRQERAQLGQMRICMSYSSQAETPGRRAMPSHGGKLITRDRKDFRSRRTLPPHFSLCFRSGVLASENNRDRTSKLEDLKEEPTPGYPTRKIGGDTGEAGRWFLHSGCRTLISLVGNLLPLIQFQECRQTLPSLPRTLRFQSGSD